MNTLTSKQDDQQSSGPVDAVPQYSKSPDATKSVARSPHPLDGSQYHNIIEEQEYAERRPTAEEQQPWRIAHPGQEQPSSPASSETAISVGTK